MTHILYINHTRQLHGSEQVLLMQMAQAKKRGDHVTLVLPSCVKDEGLHAAAASCCDVILSLPYRPTMGSCLREVWVHFYNLYALVRLCIYGRFHRVNKVVSNTMTTTIGLRLARRLSLPHEWHIHEMPDRYYGWRSWMRGYYQYRMAYNRNTNIYISRYQRDAFVSLMGPVADGQICFNPLRKLPVVSPIPHEGRVIGFVGSFVRRKNIPLLVNVFMRLFRENPSVRLLLVGARSADEIEQIRSLCGECSSAVEIVRETNDVASLLARMDIFVLPSWSEVMPVVVDEAISAGLKVCCTDRCAVGERYQPGVDYYPFSPDNPEQLYLLLKQNL